MCVIGKINKFVKTKTHAWIEDKYTWRKRINSRKLVKITKNTLRFPTKPKSYSWKIEFNVKENKTWSIDNIGYQS